MFQKLPPHLCPRPESPALLLNDGHASRSSWDNFERCQREFSKWSVFTLFIGSHSSQRTQSNDRGLNLQMDTVYRDELRRFIARLPAGQRMKAVDYVRVILSALNRANDENLAQPMDKRTIVEAFKKTAWMSPFDLSLLMLPHLYRARSATRNPLSMPSVDNGRYIIEPFRPDNIAWPVLAPFTILLDLLQIA